jgi:hypothetical protein
MRVGDAEIAHLAAQRRPADAKNPGGLCPVLYTVPDNLSDELASASTVRCHK